MYVKWRMYAGIYLNIWETAKYVSNDLELLEMAQIYGKWLEHLTNGLNMWELT